MAGTGQRLPSTLATHAFLDAPAPTLAWQVLPERGLPRRLRSAIARPRSDFARRPLRPCLRLLCPPPVALAVFATDQHEEWPPCRGHVVRV